MYILHTYLQVRDGYALSEPYELEFFNYLQTLNVLTFFFIGFNKEKYNIFSVRPLYCYRMSSSYIKLY